MFHTEAVFCGIEKVRSDYVEQCKQWSVPFRAIQKKRGFDPLVYLRLYKAFRKASPDVLFLHGATFILPAILYKRFHRNVKIIVRDTQAHHLKYKREWYWLKLAVRHSNNMVFLTKESLEVVVKKMNDPSLQTKSIVIPNGLDTDLYSRAPTRDLSEKIIIGMQSRLQSIKDHPTLLKAFALLIKKYPNRQIVLRIAGDGETRAALEKLSEELQVDRQTEFCGMLSEKDLIAFMNSLDIYVHASFGETMSNSIMQAMACGLPVIASDVWGINNMIADKVNGILYRSKDEMELYECLNTIIHDSELRAKLAGNARSYAERTFSSSELFKRYSQLF